MWSALGAALRALSKLSRADIHHGHTALIVLFRSAGILLLHRLHALLGDFQVHACAINEFLARAFQNLFQFLLGFSELLLMKEGKGLIVDFQLRLDTRINQLDASALGGRRRS
jgi:hypothetical protein